MLYDKCLFSYEFDLGSLRSNGLGAIATNEILRDESSEWVIIGVYTMHVCDDGTCLTCATLTCDVLQGCRGSLRFLSR